MKPFVKVPLWLSLLATATLTVPDEWAGVEALIEVLLATFTPVAAVPPKVTRAPLRKFVPVIVTAVPPDVVPEFGAIAVTLGAGFA